MYSTALHQCNHHVKLGANRFRGTACKRSCDCRPKSGSTCRGKRGLSVQKEENVTFSVELYKLLVTCLHATPHNGRLSNFRKEDPKMWSRHSLRARSKLPLSPLSVGSPPQKGPELRPVLWNVNMPGLPNRSEYGTISMQLPILRSRRMKSAVWDVQVIEASIATRKAMERVCLWHHAASRVHTYAHL